MDLNGNAELLVHVDNRIENKINGVEKRLRIKIEDLGKTFEKNHKQIVELIEKNCK